MPTKTKKYVPHEQAGAIFAALDVANLFRQAMGFPLLDAMPLSTAKSGDAKECLLAQAFNANCSVDYDCEEADYPRKWVEDDDPYGTDREPTQFSRGGVVRFSDEDADGDVTEGLGRKLATQFAQESGVEGMEFGYNDEWAVPLRDEITEIAQTFDSGDLKALIKAEERKLFDLTEEELVALEF